MMIFNSLSNPEFASVISDAFFFWLILTIKATVITTALLAIVHIRNRWRPDLSFSLLWKSGIVTLAALPLLAFTPGLTWSVDYLGSRSPINQPVWSVWVNSGLSDESPAKTSAFADKSATSNVAASSSAGPHNPTTDKPSSQKSSAIAIWLRGLQCLTVFCWIALAFVFASRKFWVASVGTCRWFQSLKTGPTPEDWKQDLMTLKNRLNVRRHVDLLISSRISSPVALGIRRARIILPEAANSWSSEERQAAIAHELSHIKNRDLEFYWVSAVAQSCFWFLPWVHRLVQWLILDQERDGDQVALACGVPKDTYLVFLTNVAARVRSETNLIPVGGEKLQLSSVGLRMASGNESSLKRRVQSIACFDAPQTAGARAWPLIVATSLLAAGVGLGSAQINFSEEKTGKPEKHLTADSQTEVNHISLLDELNLEAENLLFSNSIQSNPESSLTSKATPDPQTGSDSKTPEVFTRVLRISAEESEIQKLFERLRALGFQPPASLFFNKRIGALLFRGTSNDWSALLPELMNHQIRIETSSFNENWVAANNWHTRVFKVQNPEVIASIRQNSQEWLESFIQELKGSGANIHSDTQLFVTENNPEQILIKALEQDMDWITEALTLKVAVKAAIHAKFTILEMDESVAKEFVQLWSEGDQIRTEFDYQVRESSGLQEALVNSMTNQSLASSDKKLNPTDETTANETEPKSEDFPKLQMILPDSKYREVMKWVKGQSIDILSAPQVTTLTSRQAQIQIAQEISVVNGVETSEGTTNYTTQQIPYGLSIDMIPTVDLPGAEEISKPAIDLALVVQFSEFLGYDDPKDLSKTTTSDNQQGPKPVIPLPRSRKRTLTTQVNIPDGDALLIGSLPTINKQTMKSKVPMLGDLPHIGKIFRREQSQEVRKLRFIIVQPTIVKE